MVVVVVSIRPGGGSHCCNTAIAANGLSCNDNPAPCNIYPTSSPTDDPTEFPTPDPTVYPTEYPTKAPTEAPTEVPTEQCALAGDTYNSQQIL